MLLALLLGAGPADRLPRPRPEPCLEIGGEPDEGELVMAQGLDYSQVRGALNGVLQTALYCPRPPGMDAVHLTYELIVGCDGVVGSVELTDDGGAPEDYGRCVAAVLERADFPAHDMPDGMLVTYPVDVSW
jgi:hypothetical protein